MGGWQRGADIACHHEVRDDSALITLSRMLKPRVLASCLLVIGGVAAGCSSSGNAPAGESDTPTRTTQATPAPSSPARADTYTTSQFLDGDLTVTLPDGWQTTEDSSGEFGVTSDGEWRVLVWTDVYPSASKKGIAPTELGRHVSTAQITGWLKHNDNLQTVDAGMVRIGQDGIRMAAVDVSLAADAVNDDPGCPFDACVNFLGYSTWGEPYGLAGKSATRFMFADVVVSGTPRLLVVGVEAPSRAQLPQRIADADAYLDSLELPLS